MEEARHCSSEQFFHGTSALAAACISIDGFRLLNADLRNYGDGMLGGGIYVTASLKTAGCFAKHLSSYVLSVRLAPGSRILRLDGSYDRSVIDSLRREFGKDILTTNFTKAIPSNKHLRSVELISLLNYLWTHAPNEGCRRLLCLYCESALVKRYAAKLHYSALGDPQSDIGIVVFNPSRVLLTAVLQVCPDGTTRIAEPCQLAACAASELKSEHARALSNAEDWLDLRAATKLQELRLSEWARSRNCLQRFCQRHNVPVTILT